MGGIFCGFVNAQPCDGGMLMDKQCQLMYDKKTNEYYILISRHNKALGYFSVSDINKYVERDKNNRQNKG